MNLVQCAYKLILVFLLLSFTLATPLMARDAEDIQQDLDNAQKELSALEKELNAKKSSLTSVTNQKKNAQSELNSVKAEIEEQEIQIEVVQLEISKLETDYEIQNLEKEQIEEQQEKQLTALYMNWKGSEDISSTLLSAEDPIKQNYYLEILAETDQEGLNSTYEKLANLKADLVNTQEQKEELVAKTEELNNKKKTLEELVRQSDQAVAQADQDIGGIRSRISSNQVQQSELIDEKQQLENEISGDTQGGQQTLISGQLYFSGSVINSPGDPSSDAFGHGIGMSQWGAYGAAKAGWSAEKIVTYYYSRTKVQARSGVMINVSGYGVMSMEDYVSGLGEVPDYACGTVQQINDWANYANQQKWSANDPRRQKYVLDNTTTVWDCWPEESIKAQVLAARSYAATSSQPICTSAACQVYKGGKKKAWAAWQTKDKYIYSTGSTANGSIIRAFYSSYNSNGKGTADNDTIWGSNSGDGSAYSYLRSVDDSSFTYKYLGRTNWRTNSYSISELNIMMNWCVNNCTTRSWFKSSVKDRVGNLQSIGIQKENSGRVKKVIFKGDKGTATVSGRYFRTMFNKWINSSNKGVNKPADNLKGITFSSLTR